MGDSGSHLLGSFFAGATILAAPHVHAEALAGDAIADLLLFVPCVDTTLVTLTRQLGGRSAFVGGRDHLSHRIVALGLTERRAVLSLYGVAAIGGAAALVLERADSSVGWAVAGAYVIFVTAMAVYLGHIDVHAAVERGGRTLPLPSELKGRYRLYEIVFDATAISVAYLLGTLVRFAESADLDPFLRRTGHMLPVILGCHLGGLWLAGKYRRPPGPAPSDAAVLLKGVALGSIAAVVAVLYTTRFDGYSRQAFAISAVLVWVFLAGGHMTLRALDDVLRRRHGARRALIYGAGRAALAIREVMASPSLGLTPFGVIDDDPLRRGSRVEGLRVMGTLDDLDDVLSRQAGRVAVVIVSAGHLAAARLETLCDICAAHGVDVRQFHSSLEGVETDGRDRTTAVIRFPRR
jgi:UDP-GlcNAc:undecaprenyl-phosphate GlcNAc-1-phosphate transferase